MVGLSMRTGRQQEIFIALLSPYIFREHRIVVRVRFVVGSGYCCDN